MSIYELPVNALDGTATSLEPYRDHALLIVNVASKCGLTPQYATLEEVHERYQERGFSVLGVPCNQFLGQEPGTAQEIAEFCSTTYGVTFPMFSKIEVNGDNRHPLYAHLEDVPDAERPVAQFVQGLQLDDRLAQRVDHPLFRPLHALDDLEQASAAGDIRSPVAQLLEPVEEARIVPRQSGRLVQTAVATVLGGPVVAPVIVHASPPPVPASPPRGPGRRGRPACDRPR